MHLTTLELSSRTGERLLMLRILHPELAPAIEHELERRGNRARWEAPSPRPHRRALPHARTRAATALPALQSAHRPHDPGRRLTLNTAPIPLRSPINPATSRQSAA